MQWSAFFNNWWGRQNSVSWQCMVYYEQLWNLWNGNKWPLYVHMGQVIMHGQRGATRCNVVRVAAQDVLFSPFLPPGQRLWSSYLRNNSIGFDNSRCIWKPVVCRGAVLYPLRPAWLMLKPRYPCLAVVTPKRPLRQYPNPLKLSFSVELWANILTYTLDLSWVIITLWQICHPYTNALHNANLSDTVHQISMKIMT